MKIIHRKEFKQDNIPDISTASNVEVTNTIEEMINNYRIIAKNSKFMLEESLRIHLSKPITMYNLGFWMEINLKLFLLIKNKNIRKIESMRHNIYNLIECSKKTDANCDFNELISLIKKFKNRHNQNLDYNTYQHFKYNHYRGKDCFIFDYDYNSEDFDKIESVIEWVDINLLME